MHFMQDHLKQKEWQKIMGNNNIKIRKMVKDDIASCINLEKTHNTHILSENILSGDLTKDNYYYIVATEKEKIVGYAGISYILDSADLISIVVDKNYTNRKIATLMFEELFKVCKEKNITHILLEVRISNTAAINLYTKLDFKQISIRKKYYENYEDAIIMKKELNF